MKHFNRIILAVFGFLAAAAQASDDTPTLVEFKSTVLTFDLGRSEVSADDFKTLKQAVSDARASGRISKIEVAAWSDKEHPISGDLSKADRDLAESRLSAIKKDLRSSVGRMKYVHEYNMAENSNWVGRHFHSSKAELDKVYATHTKGQLTREDLALIKAEGAATKAVVILKVRSR
jgi:hypothetical protein